MHYLQNLLKEHVSIRDILTIFETLADEAGKTKDVEVFTEVLMALSIGIFISLFIYSIYSSYSSYIKFKNQNQNQIQNQNKNQIQNQNKNQNKNLI